MRTFRVPSEKKPGHHVDLVIPSRVDVLSIKGGDPVRYCLGTSTVIEDESHRIARGEDLKGRAFACFYVTFGSNGGAMSGSIKEDEPVASVAASDHFTSWGLTRVAEEALAGKHPVITTH